jgi:hypothetical protein|tara:strand:- start:1363 stop:2193 length:831 start_codon:yes stop_codon:yes gene_type:complete
MSAVTGLAGEIIAFTYPSLIKVSDNDILPTTTSGRLQPAVISNPNRTSAPNALANLSDGNGNLSSLGIGLQNAGVKITGPTYIDGQDCANIVSDNLLEVNGGGVCIEKRLYVSADGNNCTNSICGTTNLRFANFDCNAMFNASLTACGDVDVFGTSTLGGAVCMNDNLTVCGDIRACNDIIAFYTSDKTLKNNIIKINDSNRVINNLNGYTYEWDEKSGREGAGVGVIAQEVEELIPSAVRENDNGYLSVDYLQLIPYLIEEVKSLNNRIKTLEKK